MKIGILALIVAVANLITSCDSHKIIKSTGEVSHPIPNDRKWAEALVGQWRGVATYPSSVVDCQISYLADGKSTGEGTITTNGEKVQVNWKQTWHVADGYLQWTIIESNIPNIWPAGFSSTDKIVDVTSEEFTYVTEDGESMVERRVR